MPRQVSLIQVVVTGATGKMSRETIAAVQGQPDMRLAGLVSRQAATAPAPVPGVPWSATLDPLLDDLHPDVVVDFSSAASAVSYARTALGRGVAFVSGTTGLQPGDLEEIERLAGERGVGAVIAPNFAVGAVLLVHLSTLVARHFDWAELIELHHEQKADAPSGTALQTAQAMVAARGSEFHETIVLKQTVPGTRGGSVGGVHVHSVRLPGLMAHQEVLFGGLGQTLTLRHDTTGRLCYMPGVMLAIRSAVEKPAYVFGLAKLLGL